MSGQSTVISAGGATVAASGIYTAQAIDQVQTLLNNNPGTTTVEIYGQNGVPPIPTVPSGAAGTYALIVPNGVNAGSIALPTGYGAVLLGEGSSATVTGGDANTTVLSGGALNYTGTAGAVADSFGSGTINDSANAAVLSLGGGSYSVTAGGSQQFIRIDNGSNDITATGAGDTFQLGDPPITSPGAGAAAALPATTNILNLQAGASAAVVNLRSGSNQVNDAAGSTTINGLGGSATVFAASNDVYYGAAASALFVGAGSAQTVFGGSGNNTVFGNAAGSQIVDHFGTGNNIFVAEAASSTVFGGGTGAIFGGTASTSVLLGNGNDLFVGGGGSDSVYGGNTTPTVFGTSNEILSVVGSHAAFEVALGNNDVINASNTEGGNNFFALSSSGNTTLTGSTGTATDTFNLVSVAGGSAHTITIQNWHTGDGLFLNGYSTADQTTMDNAVNGGGSTFTLSDGTTVTFQGAHPQHAIGTGAF